MSYLLPHIRQAITANGESASTPWYAWFSRIEDAIVAGDIGDAEGRAAISAIATALGSPDGTVENIPPQAGAVRIVGNYSVVAQGADGVYTIALQNDQPEPPALTYYGTDADGVRGFHEMPNPTIEHNRIDANGDIRVAADGSLRITL